MRAIKIEFNNNVVRVLIVDNVTYFDVHENKIEVLHSKGSSVYYKGIRSNELNESNFQMFIDQIYNLNSDGLE
jgi:hypothetical protein